MAEDIVMPRLSDSMEEGVVLFWMKSVGDEVALGEELVEIETDKANMVYESDIAGTLLEIIADTDATVAIGEPIARIGDPGEKPESPSGDSQAEPEPKTSSDATQDRKAKAVAEASAGTGERGSVEDDDSAEPPRVSARAKASPLARRIAADEGVDLASLSGSGPGGRVVKADVRSALDSGATGSAPDGSTGKRADESAGSAVTESAKGGTETVELSRLQQTVARRMSQAKATAPHFYLSTEVDMSACFEARAGIKASALENADVPSFNDMIVKACAISLKEFPKANGSYKDGRLELHSEVNIGVAVAARDALVVPVVTNADLKGLSAIASATREIATKVRDGSITPPELSGGTFSVSNLGMYGISHFDAVINTPQAAILAVGSIEERSVVRGGEIEAAKMMSLTLSCDHRILYGAEGAEFLARIRAILEQPVSLAL